MWRIILLVTCVLWSIMDAEASSRNMHKRSTGSGSYSGSSGSYSGSSGGTGAYSGNYNDYDDFGYAPDFGFGFLDPYAFHQQLTAQILAQNAAHQNAIASTLTTGDATVTAGASNLPNDFQDLNDLIQRQQAVFFDNLKHQNNNNYNSKDDRYAPSYSAAAASVGPKGGYQTAYISPENPAIPNISNRFSSSSPDGGFKGVSVSSYSSSSDVNGKKTSHRGAQTTINDNGRVTTYKVES